MQMKSKEDRNVIKYRYIVVVMTVMIDCDRCIYVHIDDYDRTNDIK